MAGTLEQVWIGGDGAWWIQAVGMPPKTTQGAWEDGTVLSRGLLASVADDWLLLPVHNLVVIVINRLRGLLFPVSTCQLTCCARSRRHRGADERLDKSPMIRRAATR